MLRNTLSPLRLIRAPLMMLVNCKPQLLVDNVIGCDAHGGEQ